MLPDFKTYYTATIITKAWREKKKQTNQWKKTESLEIDPNKYSQLIFDRGAKVI